ncbi:hypothetical protein VTN00DRAFT_8968 [Thermoascus crustaceus]|uniref:uncharacterized protein n=1 Tax=Thermoascus crustaceus TaxID=5088 RepID=UPI0037435121
MSYSSRTFPRTLQCQLPWSRTVRARPSTATAPLLALNQNQNFARRAITTAYTTASSGPQSKWPRHLRTLLYVGIFGALGVYFDSFVSFAPPLPGTDEDAALIKKISRRLETCPITKELREDPDYVEWDAYGSFSDEEKAHRLTSGPLRGARGLALQRIFWNEKEKKAINIVWLGPGLDGWPMVVHGGVLSTVLDECLGRVALRSFPARTGVTANLNINYRAPVRSGDLYTVYATLDQERSTDRKAYVKGQILDDKGKLYVEATGLFVVPKNLTLRKIGDNF